MLNQILIRGDFNPADIAFSTLSTMWKAVLETMFLAKEGKVHVTDLHEGIAIMYFTYSKTYYI